MSTPMGGGTGAERRPNRPRLPSIRVSVLLFVTLYAFAALQTTDGAQFNLRINKYYYLLQTQWGKPAQSLYLALDLGTRDLWVYGGMCYVISKQCKMGTNDYYKKANSTTYSARSGQYTLDYNTIYQWNGSVSMDVSNDQFAVGQSGLGTQDFGLVKQADWSMYKSVNTSGIFGLGIQSATNTTSYLQSFLDLGRTNSATANYNITLYSNRNTSTGVLTVGPMDTTNCNSNWVYIRTIANGSGRRYWEVPLTNFRFGTYNTGLSGHSAIFSTLISYMVVPPSVFAQIRPRVRQVVFDYSRTHNLVDCNDRAKFPNFTLTIGGTPFNVTPWEYIWQTPSNFCILKIEPSGGGNRWILGYPFHRGHCELFNYQTYTIGIVRSRAS
ncbi:Eukaryotic aspartyl protease [Aphelenchoides fujianensis]|nr:Eukaryotic aspartyl protease [Aphelenchoides fujianensis]